jgi:hypothetical protein
VITSNAALCSQADRVQAFLQAGILRQRLAEVKEQLQTTGSERAYYAGRVEHFAEVARMAGAPGMPKPPRASGTKPPATWCTVEREQEVQATLTKLEDRAKDLLDRSNELQLELEEAEAVADGATRVTMSSSKPPGVRTGQPGAEAEARVRA